MWSIERASKVFISSLRFFFKRERLKTLRRVRDKRRQAREKKRIEQIHINKCSHLEDQEEDIFSVDHLICSQVHELFFSQQLKYEK